MKWFVETTEWDSKSAVNHVYLLSDDRGKMFACRPFGTGEIKWFKNPIHIDTRGRKFQVNPQQFETGERQPDPAGQVIAVKGSKGDTYWVTEQDGTWACSCSGFRFRGRCRHVDEVSK
jgi:hypothetical protein